MNYKICRRLSELPVLRIQWHMRQSQVTNLTQHIFFIHSNEHICISAQTSRQGVSREITEGQRMTKHWPNTVRWTCRVIAMNGHYDWTCLWMPSMYTFGSLKLKIMTVYFHSPRIGHTVGIILKFARWNDKWASMGCSGAKLLCLLLLLPTLMRPSGGEGHSQKGRHLFPGLGMNMGKGQSKCFCFPSTNGFHGIFANSLYLSLWHEYYRITTSHFCPTSQALFSTVTFWRWELFAQVQAAELSHEKNFFLITKNNSKPYLFGCPCLMFCLHTIFPYIGSYGSTF